MTATTITFTTTTTLKPGQHVQQQRHFSVDNDINYNRRIKTIQPFIPFSLDNKRAFKPRLWVRIPSFP